jgi:hypothetical protein
MEACLLPGHKDWVTVDELDVEISGPALMLPK